MQQYGQGDGQKVYAYGSCNSSMHGAGGDHSPRGGAQRMQGSCCSNYSAGGCGDRSPRGDGQRRHHAPPPMAIRVSQAEDAVPAAPAIRVSQATMDAPTKISKKNDTKKSSTKKSKSKNPSGEQAPSVRGSLAVPGSAPSTPSGSKKNKPTCSCSCSSIIGGSPSGSPAGRDNDID